MVKRSARTLALLIVFLLGGELARAGAVRIDFSGTVDGINTTPGSSSLVEDLGDSVLPGSAFAGWFVFDDSGTSPFPDSGTYSFPIPPWSLVFTVGSLTGNGRTPLSIVTATDPGDTLFPNVQVSSSVDPPLELSDASLKILLKDPDGHPLASADLIDVPWDATLYPFRSIEWQVARQSGSEFQSVLVLGSIASLSATPVPEPPGGALVGLTLLGWAVAGFLRARS